MFPICLSFSFSLFCSIFSNKNQVPLCIFFLSFCFPFYTYYFVAFCSVCVHCTLPLLLFCWTYIILTMIDISYSVRLSTPYSISTCSKYVLDFASDMQGTYIHTFTVHIIFLCFGSAGCRIFPLDVIIPTNSVSRQWEGMKEESCISPHFLSKEEERK